MNDRDDLIYREACALWRELFGESPPQRVDGSAMLQIIIGRAAPDAPYERLTSPYMRPTEVAFPKASRT